MCPIEAGGFVFFFERKLVVLFLLNSNLNLLRMVSLLFISFFSLFF